MTANKFVLVPEDIYKGLTSTNTGNINLDFVKRSLENVKKEKTSPTNKYAHYNQELRRYLFLKKKHEDKPVKVEIVKKAKPATEENELETDDGLSTISRSSPHVSSLGDESEITMGDDRRSVTTTADTEDGYDTADETQKPGIPSPNLEERCEQLSNLLKSNSKFGVTSDGKILNEKGHAIQSSNIKASVRHILNNKFGNKQTSKKPAGTKYIEDIIDKEPMLKVYSSPIKTKKKEEEEPETPKNTFQAKLWS